MFFDEAKIHVKAGRGGDGCVAFRREWGVPKGGPSGGNGGKGGDIYLQANQKMSTLLYFGNKNYFASDAGKSGGGKKLHGRAGQDVVIQVPLGTVVRDAETGRVMADLVEDGQQVRVAMGGRPGRGNAAFATATNQAPRMSERGEPGEERWLELELKMIADVGLVGMPNAGKSTLLSAISAARPKIAAYPFTTLQPSLGMVALDYETTFVVADLPGLIQGASMGTGLGHEFLRHVERTRLLVHLLDGMAEDPVANYDVINHELSAFSSRLASTPQIVVFNKMDLPDAEQAWPLVQEAFAERGIEALCISGATGQGVKPLLHRIAHRLSEIPTAFHVEEIEPEPQVDVKAFSITPGEDGWIVRGIEIERAARMTHWDQYESQARFQRILEALGISMALREAGVVDGDTVFIGETELEWGWRPI